MIALEKKLKQKLANIKIYAYLASTLKADITECSI